MAQLVPTQPPVMESMIMKRVNAVVLVTVQPERASMKSVDSHERQRVIRVYALASQIGAHLIEIRIRSL